MLKGGGFAGERRKNVFVARDAGLGQPLLPTVLTVQGGLLLFFLGVLVEQALDDLLGGSRLG